MKTGSHGIRVALLLGAMLIMSGCRYQTTWSGAEFVDRGEHIRLAAEEPLCGCLVLKNYSDRDITLRATIHGEPLGLQVLPRASTLAVRFDWAGPNGDDTYQLEGFDASGRPVTLRDLTVIDDNGWPWRVCSSEPECPIGPLMMNMGENRR